MSAVADLLHLLGALKVWAPLMAGVCFCECVWSVCGCACELTSCLSWVVVVRLLH